MMEQDQLVRAWIMRYEKVQAESDASPAAQELYWAYEKLDDACWQSPAKAFEIILAILNATNNEFVLDNLAAGPLESVLVRHGNQVINLVESEAKSNTRFRQLLSGVWQNTMNDELWHRVQGAAHGAD
jgi:hypothetical protein